MKTGRISSNGIQTSLRLNGGFHLNESTIFENKIMSREWDFLKNLTKEIFTAGRSKRIYVKNPKKGIPFLGNTDVNSVNPKDSCTYASKYFWRDNKAYLQTGMILTGRVGQNTVGRFSLVREDYANTIGSDNIIRIVPQSSDICNYLYAFLSSKYGYSLTRKHITGAAQPFITEEMIGSVPVPILPNQNILIINGLIEEAAQLRVEANRLLEEAVKEIENRLPQLNFRNIYATSVAVFSIQKSRLDATSQLKAIAEFYESINNLENVELKSIGELSNRVFTPNIFKRLRVNNPANGVPFLSGINLLECCPKFDSFLSRKMPNIKDYELREGWLAIQDSGSISSMGYVSLIPKFLEGVTATNNLVRIIPNTTKDYNPYIYAFLKSLQGQQIIKSLSYGTGQLHIDNNQITHLSVPIFNDIFENVTAKVLAFNNKFNRAYELETAAIGQVEEWIEAW